MRAAAYCQSVHLQCRVFRFDCYFVVITYAGGSRCVQGRIKVGAIDAAALGPFLK